MSKQLNNSEAAVEEGDCWSNYDPVENKCTFLHIGHSVCAIKKYNDFYCRKFGQTKLKLLSHPFLCNFC